MTNKQKSSKSDILLNGMRDLHPFYKRFSTGKFGEKHMFVCCVKAAFTRAYEVSQHLISPKRANSAFMQVPALRAVCEDLIVLKFLSTQKSSLRNKLIEKLMLVGVLEDIETQAKFFKKYHPAQNILVPASNHATNHERIVLEIQNLWKLAGWNLGGKKMSPPIRQIAEKAKLLELYDFMYDLTSKLVHFRPGVLLRSGWGPMPMKTVTFSTKNFHVYYFELGRIYSTYLLCLYFELLPKQLNPDEKANAAVTTIRQDLLSTYRWPELVTFEEMNLPVPKNSLAQIMAHVAFARTTTRLLRPSRAKKSSVVTAMPVTGSHSPRLT